MLVTRSKKLVIVALMGLGLAWALARWLCWKPVYVEPPLGWGKFQVEISSLGYWARCDMKVPNREGPELFNCSGDRMSGLFKLDSSLDHFLVPCTLTSVRVRILRYDAIVYDGVVTSQCSGSGTCVFGRRRRTHGTRFHV